MTQKELAELLRQVKTGDVEIDEAVNILKLEPVCDVGYAKIDMHRELRQGVAEVIYGAGKTAEQIAGIASKMWDLGQRTILITRMEKAKTYAIAKELPFTYYEESEIGLIGSMIAPNGNGKIVIATGGTSDHRVAEEAALTAEILGNHVVRLYDVGVAGVHRLIANSNLLAEANVAIAIAGMEGALASVVGGLVDCPVIAVPTSVGYGASFGGLSALLSMLNSCASGVGVVNIDNGFGAGYLASMINQRTQKSGE